MKISEPITDENYFFESIEEQLPSTVNIVYYGWHKCSSSHTNYASFKRCHTLHIIVDGKGYFGFNDKQYTLKKNDIFLINPAETVNYYPDETTPWEYFWIGFSGNGSDALIKSLSLVESHIGTLISIEKIIRLFNSLKDKNSTDKLSPFGKYSVFYSVLDELLLQSKYVSSRFDNGNQLITQAQNYISEHYRDDVSISKMSECLCVERTTLFKAFKKAFGISPQQYVIDYRLRIAQQLICETQSPFTQISADCGFINYSHFSRIFTDRFGCNPSEMRKSAVYGGVLDNNPKNEFHTTDKS